MRALTLTQPWCGLVASGLKLVENRPRRIVKREDIGKPFALHASREIDELVFNRLAEIDPSFDIRTIPSDTPWLRLARITSAVIAVATIDDALYIGGCSREYVHELLARRGLSDQARFTFGPTVYILRDIRALAAPVPCRGWQGFWTLPADIERAVVAQIGAAP